MAQQKKTKQEKGLTLYDAGSPAFVLLPTALAPVRLSFSVAGKENQAFGLAS